MSPFLVPVLVMNFDKVGADDVTSAMKEFLDMKPSTWNNNMCSPDNQRMWAGLVDFYGGPGNLPIHVNQRGHEHVANVIARS